MERDYDPVDGIGRFQAGTPPILALAAVEEGVRADRRGGHRRAAREVDRAVPTSSSRSTTPGSRRSASRSARPATAARRGSHVSLRHPEAWPINVALIERAAVVPDFRGPDSIRLGVAPLYTGHADVWDALDRLRGLVERGEHRLVDTAPGRVT